ncbi:hypothetical protein AB2S62_06370 [Vibrio sp. NTOU-M3]|uniref:hypothetical protein n=1 Tax=Vibrio sp. NTOU-M3 TaxID=3234954 RepID=UPI00349F782A
MNVMNVMILSLLFVLGCSDRSLYESTQQYRMEECKKIPTQLERRECLEQANRNYHQYQSERIPVAE